MRFRRFGVAGERWLVLIRLRQDHQKLFERRKIVAVHGGIDDRFYQVIPRNEGWIDGAHRGLPRDGVLRFIADSFRINLGQNAFKIFGAGLEPFLLGAAVLSMYWLILFWMYRRKVFLKI